MTNYANTINNYENSYFTSSFAISSLCTGFRGTGTSMKLGGRAPEIVALSSAVLSGRARPFTLSLLLVAACSDSPSNGSIYSFCNGDRRALVPTWVVLLPLSCIWRKE